MKRGTPEHPKTSRLARQLRVPLAQAIGTLEALWHWCGRYCQQGDIGRFDDEEIAAGAYWHGKPQRLIQALVECGWLEVHPVHRLIVHDWHDHADDAVKKWLDRHRLSFLTVVDTVVTVSGHSRDSGSLPLPLPLPKPEPMPQTDTGVPSATDSELDGLFPGREDSKPKPKGKIPTPAHESILAVFSHYRTYHPQSHRNPRPGSDEWKKIANRLADGYSVADLCAAIDGCHKTPHNLGDNEQGAKYLGLNLIVRTASQVDRFMGNNANPPRPREKPEHHIQPIEAPMPQY